LTNTMSPIYYSLIYCFLAFTFGALSGVRAITKKYGERTKKALRTWPAFAYCLLRAGLSVITFLFLYSLPNYFDLFNQKSWLLQHPWFWALICGTGAESVLRSKIFVKSKAGGEEPIMRGPLTLIEFFQDLFFDLIEKKVPSPRDIERTEGKRKAKRRRDFLYEHMPPGTFDELCSTVEWNLVVFEPHFPEEVGQIRQRIERDLASYLANVKPLAGEEFKRQDQLFKFELGYFIMEQVDEDFFSELTNPVPADPKPLVG